MSQDVQIVDDCTPSQIKELFFAIPNSVRVGLAADLHGPAYAQLNGDPLTKCGLTFWCLLALALA